MEERFKTNTMFKRVETKIIHEKSVEITTETTRSFVRQSQVSSGGIYLEEFSDFVKCYL